MEKLTIRTKLITRLVIVLVRHHLTCVYLVITVPIITVNNFHKEYVHYPVLQMFANVL